MYCDTHKCSCIELTTRTAGDITIKLGRCNVGKEVIMEKWRKVRAMTLPRDAISRDQEAMLRIANYKGVIKCQTAPENAVINQE